MFITCTDGAVTVLDAESGVEPQTEQLGVKATTYGFTDRICKQNEDQGPTSKYL